MAICDICRKCEGARVFTAEVNVDDTIIRVRIQFDSWLTMRWLCAMCAKNILASLAGHGVESIVSLPLKAEV